MEFLTRLLGVDVPDNTKLVGAELSFRSQIPWLLVGVGLALLLLGVSFLYSRERGTLGWPRRIVLVVLRTALLALVILLLFRPVLLAEFEGKRARPIPFLLDSSQSMQQQDRRVTDEDKARVAIAKGLLPMTTNLSDVKSAAKLPQDLPLNPARTEMVGWVLGSKELKLIETLQERGPVQPLLFGARSRGPRDEGSKSVNDQLLASLQAREEKTALADVVHELLQRKDADPPAAMVIVTDGQDNASKYSFAEAAQECKRQQVPLYIYGVGSADGGSLQIKEVQAPETIFVDDTLTVPLRWRAQGFKEGTVIEMSLSLGGKVMVKEDLVIKLDPKTDLEVKLGEDLRGALSFVVEKRQKTDETLDLVTTLQVKNNDLFKDSQVKQVRIVDRKIKLLVIENSPRFEFKFLQQALVRDRRIEPTFLLVNADPKVANSGKPYIPKLPPTKEAFIDAKYDVILLGDVASTYLTKEHMEWIKDFVKRRGGLIVVAGRQNMPTTYKNTPLEDVLPVEFEAVKFTSPTENRTLEYRPTLTEFGQRSGMLALAETPEENLKLWNSLPGFYWQYPVTKLRAGATPLVVNPQAKLAKQPMPLVATQFYGKGQVLFCGSDETWRWRFNAEDKHFLRYWGQIVYQMGLPHLLGDSAKRTQFALEHAEATLNRPGQIFVRLLDKQFDERKDDKVEGELVYLDAKPGQETKRKVTLQSIPGHEGDFRALLTHDRPGRYEFRVNNPEPETYAFRVEAPRGHELEETGLADKALRNLAEASGGKFYREEDLHKLTKDLEQRKASFGIRQEVVLWNPLALLLFVGLITAEWLVRKFSNLS